MFCFLPFQMILHNKSGPLKVACWAGICTHESSLYVKQWTVKIQCNISGLASATLIKGSQMISISLIMRYIYSKIPSTWLALDRTGGELLNIPDYQVVLLLTIVLTDNILLLLLYLGCTSNQRIIPFGYLLHPLAGSYGSSSMFSGVFMHEETAAEGDKALLDIWMTDVQTHLEALSTCSWYQPLSFKKPFSWLKAKQCSRYSGFLRPGRTRGRFLVGGEIFHPHPDRPRGPPSLLYNGYGLFPGGNVDRA